MGTTDWFFFVHNPCNSHTNYTGHLATAVSDLLAPQAFHCNWKETEISDVLLQTVLKGISRTYSLLPSVQSLYCLSSNYFSQYVGYAVKTAQVLVCLKINFLDFPGRCSG